MQERRQADVQKYKRRHQKRKAWRNVVRVLACVVVFCTTYALILPAITMEKDAFCGIEAHVHEEACYGELAAMVCEPGADLPVIHSHDALCYSGETLICKLTEAVEHIHGESCYETVTLEAHTHGESCYAPQRGNLLCEIPEEESHAHGGDCYTPGETLLCTEAERAGHSHGAACYNTETVLTCTTAETQGHSHGEGCYDADGNLICTEAEVAAHTHGDGCYTTTQTLICTEAEDPGHTHGNDCYEQVLSCTLEEKAGHAHTDECYEMTDALTCGLEERAETVYNRVLVCTLPQVAVHTHADACYEGGVLTCQIQCATVHQHTEDCIQIHAQTEENLICELEVHEHTLACYSNPQADVESSADWEESVSKVTLTGNWRQDLVAIAKSQLGYNESTKNYIVGEDGETIYGYSRYGAWYGAPYGDWCAMYASFCIRYAGISGMPLDANCPNWIRQLAERGLYHDESDYTPEAGDLIFFDWNDDGSSDHVGIVVEVNGEKVKTIEGNAGDTVAYHTYDSTDATIQGYGRLPRQLTEEERAAVDNVIGLIEAMPSAEQIEAKIAEFEEAEDYEGEEAWLTEVYQQVGDVYVEYYFLGEELQQFVTNRDKLLELEYIWSMMPLPESGTQIAVTANYSTDLLVNTELLVLYFQSGSDYYALDGYGNVQKLTVASQKVYSDVSNPNTLYWVLTKDGNTGSKYQIRNAATGKFIACENGAILGKTASSPTITHTQSNGTFTIRSGNDKSTTYVGYDSTNQKLNLTNNSNAAKFRLARANAAGTYVWFDGSCGNIESLEQAGDYRQKHLNSTPLPEAWQSPSRYDYTLRGWYDIYNHKYYKAGDTATFTSSTVLYADWVATTYDIGQSDSHVVKTLSTNHFVTTRMFDYSAIFNMYSVVPDRNNSSIDTGSHSEVWSEVKSGNVGYQGKPTLGFVFRDWDTADKHISYPKNRSDATNFYDSNNNSKYPYGIQSGLYSTERIAKLFSTANATDPTSSSFVLGQEYLGTADHLLQYDDGYYTYDSQKNAAAYNQSAGRFYVYDYLTRGSDAAGAGNDDPGKYSDFFPLNYHTVNTNGQPVLRYEQPSDGRGQVHYQYNSVKIADEPNKQTAAGTNMWLGMQMDIEFYLPSDVKNANGTPLNGNKDGKSRDMVFKFAGDDDVWVLIGDGIDANGNLTNPRLLLDLGGIHRITTGEIDFSTGEITLGGQIADNNAGNLKALETQLEANLATVKKGTHYLRMYYLERGDSQSNLFIQFNITPRYELQFQKEDFLYGSPLNGAQFGVFTDQACTVPAKLWVDEYTYENNPSNTTHTFTIENGTGSIWGLEAGNVYYIKELIPPEGYTAGGIIKLSLDHLGESSYEVLSIIPGAPPGFGAYGFRMDETKEMAYMTITNGKAQEATEVTVTKQWADNSQDIPTKIMVQLMYGTRELGDPVPLSASTGWTYTWTNLPRYLDDGTPIVYTVKEKVVSGYVGVLSRPTIAEDGKISYTLTNVPADSLVDIPVTKQWQDPYGTVMDASHPAADLFIDQEVIVKLMLNDEQTGKQLVLNKDNNWTGTFEDLPVVDGWNYSIMEVPLSDHWETIVEKNPQSGAYTITNRYKLRLPVEKVWDQYIPEADRGSIELQIYAMAPDSNEVVFVDTMMLTEENGWKNVYLIENPVKGTRYFVYEPAEDFLPVYSKQTFLTIEEQTRTVGEVEFDAATDIPLTLTITNYAMHELPNTGGPGTILYTAGGLLLMLAAIILLHNKYQKRRREGSSSF